MNVEKLARGLGWFSLGLGALELVAPGKLARFLGLPSRRRLIRSAYGAREVAAGVGLLRQPVKAPFLVGRVGGDLLDIATLVKGLRTSTKKRRVGIALANVLAVTLLDVIAAVRQGAKERAELGSARVRAAEYPVRPVPPLTMVSPSMFYPD